jgi:hypothetical protein
MVIVGSLAIINHIYLILVVPSSASARTLADFEYPLEFACTALATRSISCSYTKMQDYIVNCLSAQPLKRTSVCGGEAMISIRAQREHLGGDVTSRHVPVS